MTATYKQNNLTSSLLPVHTFNVYDENHLGRQKAESAVRGIFRSAFNAEINDFLPLLFTAERTNSIDAVIGICKAQQQELYLERYLSTSMEEEVKRLHQINIVRNELVEIGNLVSTRAGVSRHLFIVLTFVLLNAGIKWVSFTATKQVEQILSKLSLKPLVICNAQESFLATGNSTWGSYYQNQPKVCLGNVVQAAETLWQSSVTKKIYEATFDEIMMLANIIKLGVRL